VTDVALGHGCFRRSAGFRVGGIGVVRDLGTSAVAGDDIGAAVTVLEADVGSAAIVGISVMLETDIG
jgi:hypothetical protein